VTSSTTAVWPLVAYFGAVLILVGGMLGLSYVLGQRHSAPQTGQPFESGILATGSAHIRWDVKFYRVAMFFVVFDLEAAILFAWAVAARALGWPGYIEVCIFVAVLAIALVYLWRLGALEWAPVRRSHPPVATTTAAIAAEGGRPAAATQDV
jgi:NADH-quinone oxidoreductase subunit A